MWKSKKIVTAMAIVGALLGISAAAQVVTTVNVPLNLKISTTTDSVLIETNGTVYIKTGSKVYRNGNVCK